ncbi:MAG: hypothetical protein J4428_04935 [Candidatus Aenigmarchaeota archaeon]|nr:hypothetical protein [Candidatus Aenigmarchaeota archaeon]
MEGEIFARLDKLEMDLEELRARIKRIESLLEKKTVEGVNRNNKKPGEYKPQGDYIKDVDTEKFGFGFND